MRITAILLALFLAGCGGNDGAVVIVPAPIPSTPAQPTISMDANNWYFSVYSVGMPPHPTTSGSGWYFDFPVYAHTPTTDCAASGNACSSANYLTTQTSMALGSRTLVVNGSISVSGGAQFQGILNPNNTCSGTPSSARLFMEQAGDQMTAAEEFKRWWSNPDRIILADGAFSLSVAVTPDKWSSVFGKFGTDPAASSGWNTMLANLGAVGLTFGGGCFFGHGVNISGGSARFTVMSFSAQ